MPLTWVDGVTPVNAANLEILEADTAAVQANLTAHAAAADPHTGYQKETEKGAVNGYASLDGSGTVPDAQLPAALARDSEVTAAISAHAGAADPHPTYATDADLTAHVAAADPHTGYQKESEKGAASGYASLDGSGLVPDAQIPASIARDAEITSAITTHEGAADPHTSYQKESEKAVANGYASLDSGGKVPSAQLPAAGGLTLIADVTLASPATTIAVTSIPAGYKSLHVELVVVPTGADSSNTDIDFDFLPAVAGQWMYGYGGTDAVGTTAARSGFNANRMPMGRVQHHSVNGATNPMYWAKVDIPGGSDPAVRHGVLTQWFGRMGNTGAAGEIGFGNGGGMWRQGGTQVAVTGVQFVASANLGVGTRLTVWGRS